MMQDISSVDNKSIRHMHFVIAACNSFTPIMGKYGKHEHESHYDENTNTSRTTTFYSLNSARLGIVFSGDLDDPHRRGSAQWFLDDPHRRGSRLNGLRRT